MRDEWPLCPTVSRTIWPAGHKGITGKRTEVTPVGQGVTIQKDQSHCVHCGKGSGDHSLFNRCGACKTSRYCSKKCQAAHWPQHKVICMAIQELEN